MKNVFSISALVLLLAWPSYAINRTPDVEDIDRKKAKQRKEKALAEKNKTLGQSINEAGKKVKTFGEDMITRIDRIVKKKSFSLWGDPWTVQGLPLVFPGGHSGFHMGVRLMFHNIRRQDPHKVLVEGQVLASNEARFKHFLSIDIPRAFQETVHFKATVGFDRDITLRYFGIGNNTTLDRSLVDSFDPLYRNERTGPFAHIRALRRFGKTFQIGPNIGARWTQITAPSGSLLDTDRPLGFGGGRTHFVGLMAIDSNLDFEPYPSKGRSHELSFNWYDRAFGSDYNFLRFNYNFRKFIPLHRTLTLGTRFMFEALGGDIPFYELGAVGGLEPTLGLGGEKHFRGYIENQYIDVLRGAIGFEVRWDPLRFVVARQNFVLGFVPFMDIGRVWSNFFPLQFGGFRASVGWGARIIWNHRLVIRADFAMNSQGSQIYVNFGNNF